MHEEDEHFVWVCEEPFSFFVLDKEMLLDGYPCLKGYVKNEGDFICFYMEEDLNVRSCFVEEEMWESTSSSDAFWGYTEYCDSYFEFSAERDFINFFDGELPTLRFYKVDKAEFLKEFGHIEEVSALLG